MIYSQRKEVRMKEFKIGDRFIIPKGKDGYILIEVQEVTDYNMMHHRCKGCIFRSSLNNGFYCEDSNHIYGYCNRGRRKDEKNIIFKKLKNVKFIKRMSYNSRINCKEGQITPCGICPLMFKCPYDEDKDKYIHLKK